MLKFFFYLIILCFGVLGTRKTPSFDYEKDTRSMNYGPSFLQNALHKIHLLHNLGFSGTNVRILVIGSGFDLQHRSLSKLQIIDQRDFVLGTNTSIGSSVEENRVGTAALSVIGGMDSGNLIGVSFNASFALARVFDGKEITASEDLVRAALSWGHGLGVHIVLSLAHVISQRYSGNSQLSTLANELSSSANILFIQPMGEMGAQGLRSPSDAELVLAVGAMNLTGDANTMSSFGPSFDGRLKPEISALGMDIYAALAGSVSDYFYAEGSSMSAAIVAGAAALLHQKSAGSWSSRMFREAFMRTAEPASGSQYPSLQSGFGLMNAINAAQFIFAPCNSSCLFGTCNNNNVCVCQISPVTYYELSCFSPEINCLSYCNLTGGLCSSNHCVCKSGFSGPQCSYFITQTTEPTESREYTFLPSSSDSILMFLLFLSICISLLACSAYSYFRFNQGQDHH